jgi:putative hemolysin
MPIIERGKLLAILIAGGWLLAACGKSSSETGNAAQAAAAQPQSTPAASAEKPAGQSSLASIFPPGPGRELVLNSCGSCHSAVCAARGQRTAERWDSIKKDHKEKLSGSSSEDLNVMFSYLTANFNDTKPEPQIAPELLQQGCTPF